MHDENKEPMTVNVSNYTKRSQAGGFSEQLRFFRPAQRSSYASTFE